jgi:hypothetical protein
LAGKQALAADTRILPANGRNSRPVRARWDWCRLDGSADAIAPGRRTPGGLGRDRPASKTR